MAARWIEINRLINNLFISIYSKVRVNFFLGIVMSSNSFVLKKPNNQTREHLIHDNGGRPFKVITNYKEITIYSFPRRKQPDYTPVQYTEFVQKYTKFIGYWIGFDPSNYKFNGNSILIQITKNDYVYVGSRIYSFTAPDEIIDYASYVGNSDVPYPLHMERPVCIL